jgi:asparagine synthase (glutamine-hydrolysing)
MCGIFGFFKRNGQADPALIERMARCLDHRGPDGYGTYHDGRLAFGAGRLAIIDLAAGVQPIFSEDRHIAVIYNGEIYNYKMLRAELEALGHIFATHTDTEVIVHGYESWGDAIIERLRGMFALCVWDEARQRLLLARDRMGEKPLYYAQPDGDFLFASEIKALFEHPGLRRAVNTDALPFYLTLGYVPPPQTMFAGVEKLAPGERLIVDHDGMRKERYWQPVMNTLEAMPYDEAVRQVRQALTEAVEMRLMSDVPLGAFLSGGLDSTAIVALMGRAMGRPVDTFTIGYHFGDGGEDADAKFNADARFAALAAERLKTHHTAITITPDESLAEWLPHFVYAMDEPVAQVSILQTPYVAALARLHGVPVLLSGDGGDELFLGYNHYRMDRLVERYQQIPALLRRSVVTPLLERLPNDSARSLARKSRQSDPAGRYLEWMRVIGTERLPGLVNQASDPEIIHGHLRPLLNSPRTRHFADRIAFTSLNLWLAEDSNMRVDKLSMAMSIEARAPFEDHRLTELALRIPLENKLRGGDFKSVLKSAVADLVPAEILHRPKWGFTPPASEWLRTILRPLVDRCLSAEYVTEVGLFQAGGVSAMVDNHLSRRKYELNAVWSLLVFHLWHALYIDQSLTLDHKIRPADLLPEVAAHEKVMV